MKTTSTFNNLKALLAATALFICSFSFSQTANRPINQQLYPYFYDISTSHSGFSFYTPFKLGLTESSPNYKSPYPLILDSNGYVYWYSKPNASNCLDFKYHPNSNLFSYTLAFSNIVDPIYVIMDANLEIVDTIRGIGQMVDVHDLELASNGNWLITIATFDTLDLSAYTFDGQQGDVETKIKGFGYQEIDPQGNIVNEWNSNDYISPTESYEEVYGYNPNNFDYCHGNAIFEDQDGHLLLSFRHLNSIYKVNRNTGEIIWRLGGKSSDFTFLGDNGFSGQHDIKRLANGNYTLYDNGNMSGPPKITRAVEYQIDTTNWTCTLIREFTHPTNLYARAMGNFQSIEEQLKIIGYGFIRRPYPSASIIDASNEILADISFEDSVMSYRAHLFDIQLPQRPQINCEKIGEQWFLKAPEGESAYLWSTNETTSMIPITTTDTFQVWLPHGSGFIGSAPLIVTDLNNPCGLAGIEDLTLSVNLSSELYDLLGRKVNQPQPRQIYIRVFENGTSEKVLYNE